MVFLYQMHRKPSEIPEITELDELQTFVGKKKNKEELWTAVNHKSVGILAWVVGDRRKETFEKLWLQVSSWQSFWYATDGYAIYAKFIDDIKQIVSKTYPPRVEGENTRLRHKLARLHRKTLCYSLVTRDVRSFSTLATSLFEILDYPSACLNHDLIVQRLRGNAKASSALVRVILGSSAPKILVFASAESNNKLLNRVVRQ